jgi:hypothetical protein
VVIWGQVLKYHLADFSRLDPLSCPTSLSAAISGRTAGFTYYYRVRAEKNGLYSDWTAGANGCAVTTEGVGWSTWWTGNTYNLSRTDFPTARPIAIRVFYSNGGIWESSVPASNYSEGYDDWFIQIDNNQFQHWSGGYTFNRIDVYGNLPSMPSSITVPAGSSSDSYTVSWGESPTTGVTYRLQEATDSSFTAGLRTVVSGTSVLSAVISGRTAGLTYYYRVRAEKDNLSSYWVAGANGFSVGDAPGMPASISVPAGSTTDSYTISWEASPTDGVTYRLEEASNSSFTTGLRTVVSGTTSLSAAISGRTAGFTYYYRVRAEKNGLYSDWTAGANGCAVTTEGGGWSTGGREIIRITCRERTSRPRGQSPSAFTTTMGTSGSYQFRPVLTLKGTMIGSSR